MSGLIFAATKDALLHPGPNFAVENGACPCCGCDYCPNDCPDLCCKAAAGLEEPTVSSAPTTEAGEPTPYHLGWKEGQRVARATAEAQSNDLRQRADDANFALLRAEAQVAKLRAALEVLVTKYVANRGTEWRFISTRTYEKHHSTEEWDEAERVLAATPASSRFLDLDAPETVERIADELWERGIQQTAAAGRHRTPTIYMAHPDAAVVHARAIVRRLKEDRREPGDTPA